MNRQIKSLFDFLKKMGATSGDLNFGIWDDNIEYTDQNITNENGKNIPIPPPFDRYLETLVEEHMDEIYEDKNSDDTGYRRVYMTFDLENYKIKMEIEAQYYDTQSDGTSYEFEDEPKWGNIVNEVFDELKYDGEIILSYEGGGDSGYIQSEMSLTDKGEEVPVDKRLEEIGYYIINRSFSGWEINEGSQGHIYFNREEVWAEHTWNTEKERECYNEIIISANDTTD
jgi:hypothetical protein